MKRKKKKLIRIIEDLYFITEEKANEDVAFKNYIYLSNNGIHRITGISISPKGQIIYHLEDCYQNSIGWFDINCLKTKMLKRIKKELQILNS